MVAEGIGKHIPSFLMPSVPSMGPGAMQLMRIFCGPHSTAKCFVMASTDHQEKCIIAITLRVGRSGCYLVLQNSKSSYFVQAVIILYIHYNVRYGPCQSLLVVSTGLFLSLLVQVTTKDLHQVVPYSCFQLSNYNLSAILDLT